MAKRRRRSRLGEVQRHPAKVKKAAWQMARAPWDQKRRVATVTEVWRSRKTGENYKARVCVGGPAVRFKKPTKKRPVALQPNKMGTRCGEGVGSTPTQAVRKALHNASERLK